MKFSNAAYNFSFWMIKLSGYAFYTIRKLKNGNIKFYQSWLDYLAAAISVTFSIYAVFGGLHKSFDLNLKSTILEIGMMAFFQIAIVGTMVAKVNNFLYARKCFRILLDFQWIDRMVRPPKWMRNASPNKYF